MAYDRYSKRKVLVGGLNIGGTSDVLGITAASIAIDPGSIAATTRLAVTFTITGAAVGDFLSMTPPSGLNDDLLYVGCDITGADEGTVYIYNPTAGAIDDGSFTWDYLWYDLT